MGRDKCKTQMFIKIILSLETVLLNTTLLRTNVFLLLNPLEGNPKQ